MHPRRIVAATPRTGIPLHSDPRDVTTAQALSSRALQFVVDLSLEGPVPSARIVPKKGRRCVCLSADIFKDHPVWVRRIAILQINVEFRQPRTIVLVRGKFDDTSSTKQQ